MADIDASQKSITRRQGIFLILHLRLLAFPLQFGWRMPARTVRIIAALVAGITTVTGATGAGAIEGGIEVAADDLGGRASVIVTVPGGTCSGLVYGESFVITAGHCLANKTFTAALAPQDVTVTYGRSLKQPDAAVRHATAIVIHEHYLSQMAALLAAKIEVPFELNAINHEDIGLIRIEGAHPPSALSAALPAINNEYVVCCIPRPRTWPLVWLDVYGFGHATGGETLHKVRVGTSAPDMVHPGKEPNPSQPYLPRQIMVSPDDTSGGAAPTAEAAGVCHGDSGGTAFFVTTTRSRVVPPDPLKLINGQPLAVGITSRMLSPVDCDETFLLVRLDYYRDWILAHVKLLQQQ
jgi:hypothetical protein